MCQRSLLLYLTVVNNGSNELTEVQTQSFNRLLVTINNHDITTEKFLSWDISDNIVDLSVLCYFSFYMIGDIRYICLWVSLTLQALVKTSEWYATELLRNNSNDLCLYSNLCCHLYSTYLHVYLEDNSSKTGSDRNF